VHGGLLLRDADVVDHVHGGLFLPAGFIFADALWRGLLLERRRVCVRVVHGRLLHSNWQHNGDGQPLHGRLFLRKRVNSVVDASRLPSGPLVRRRPGDGNGESLPRQYFLGGRRCRRLAGGRVRRLRHGYFDGRARRPVRLRAANGRSMGGNGRGQWHVRRRGLHVHGRVMRRRELLFESANGIVVQLSINTRHGS
jgi:hypothetical protein